MSELSLQDLRIDFSGQQDKASPVVDEVSLHLTSGKVLALIGESGSGKTLTALSLLALLPAEARASGKVGIDGQDINVRDTATLAKLRGRRIGLVFQDPMSSLNPLLTIGEQIDEVFRQHHHLDKAAARTRTAALLAKLGIADAEKRLRDYPHQFSGGQRQRIAIAMAIAANPNFLIADEPTTALDVTIQAQIMDLLQRLVADGMGLLLITHDIALAAENADDIAVIYAGRIVEQASSRELVTQPRHPYTALLLKTALAIDGVLDLEITADQASRQTGWIGGCAFAPRCLAASAICSKEAPLLIFDQDRLLACHHPLPSDVEALL